MGTFTRTGTFKDRTKFVSALKSKVSRMKEGALRGFNETWEGTDPAHKVTLNGFGAKLTITVADSAWNCHAELPPWLPIPQSLVEQKLDQEFEDLKGL